MIAAPAPVPFMWIAIRLPVHCMQPGITYGGNKEAKRVSHGSLEHAWERTKERSLATVASEYRN